MSSPLFLPLNIQESRTTPGSDSPVNAAMSMPNVFVIPPEEDKTPAWCFFDAENPTFSQIIGHSEAPENNALAFSSESGSTGFRSLSVFDALGEQENENDGSDPNGERHMVNDEDPHSFQETVRNQRPRIQERESGNDSDVVEVVKFSRRKSSEERREQERRSIRALSEYKRTVSLGSRASKVFKTFRGSLRPSKSRTQRSWNHNSQNREGIEYLPQEVVERPRTPTMSRRRSRIFSQLFPGSSIKSQSSISSFEDLPAATSSLPPSLDSDFTSNAPPRSLVYSRVDHEEARLRASSPTPTMGTLRRFSMLNLHKMFPFSSTQNQSTFIASPVPFEESVSTHPSISPSEASFSTASGPQTPTSTEDVTPGHLVLMEGSESTDFPLLDLDSVFQTESGLNLGLGLNINLNPASQQEMHRKGFASSSSWSSITQNVRRSLSRNQEPEFHNDLGDTSLEMRLDSFHFDSLAFDAEQF